MNNYYPETDTDPRCLSPKGERLWEENKKDLLADAHQLSEVIQDKSLELAKIIILQRTDLCEMGQVINRYVDEWANEYTRVEE